MKKLMIWVSILFFCITILGCGDQKNIKGNRYDTYGLFNESTSHNEEIQYRIIVGNVIWSILLIETIIFPIYFIGFSLYEPIGQKDGFKKGCVR